MLGSDLLVVNDRKREVLQNRIWENIFKITTCLRKQGIHARTALKLIPDFDVEKGDLELTRIKHDLFS